MPSLGVKSEIPANVAGGNRPFFRKIDLALGLAIVGVVLVTWLPRLTGPIDLRWDGAVYYVLGTSLAEGAGYRLLNEPGEIQATQYPPLFPALIALHQIAAGTADPTVVGGHLRITFLLLSLGLGLGCYALLRGYFAPPWALVGTCLVVLHTTTIFVSDIAFAEVPYAIATILFFVVLRWGRSRATEVGAGVLAVAAFFLRTAGIALMVAWVADALLNRRFRRAGFRLAMVLPAFFGWQLYTGSIERGEEYATPSYEYQRADYLFYNVSYVRNVMLRNPERPEYGYLTLAGMSERVARNLSSVPLRVGETVSALGGDWRRQIMRARQLPALGLTMRPRLVGPGLFLLGSLVLIGLGRQFFRGEYTMPLYSLFYIGLVCLTPWTYMERYWFPLAPVLILGLFHFLGMAGDALDSPAWRRRRRWGRPVVLGGAVLLLFVQAVTLFDFYRERHQPVVYTDLRGETVSYRLFYYRETYRALDAALDQLRADAPPHAIVAASMPHWVYLRTGLRTVMPPFETDAERALALLESVPADYLVVDGRTGSFTRVFGLPAILRAPDRWMPIFVDEEGEVETYRRITR